MNKVQPNKLKILFLLKERH